MKARSAPRQGQPSPRHVVADELPCPGHPEGQALTSVSRCGEPSQGVRASVLDADEDVWVISVPLPDATLEPLTAAEREVARLVVDGASNADVARKRGTSVRTVANQLRSIYGKLGIASRAELAAAVWQVG